MAAYETADSIFNSVLQHREWTHLLSEGNIGRVRALLNPVREEEKSNTPLEYKASTNEEFIDYSANQIESKLKEKKTQAEVEEVHSALSSNGSTTMSRSLWLTKNNGKATTQGQDCCIEASSIVGPYRYYFGLIDILQEWTWQKRLERLFKIWILRKDPRGISSVHPIEYGKWRYLNSTLRSTDRAKERKEIRKRGYSRHDEERHSHRAPISIEISQTREPRVMVTKGGVRKGENGGGKAWGEGTQGKLEYF